MTKLNTDDMDVVELSVEKVRNYLMLGDEIGELDLALDYAQGDVHTGKTDERYIVIRVRP